MKKMSHYKIEPGDIVQVLEPVEIMKTLDSEGKMDKLPFLPEMLQFSGKTFTVKARIGNTCAVSFNDENTAVEDIREFKQNDVVSLDKLRCDGSAHGNCQAGCTLFWKESWLKKLGGTSKERKITTINEKEIKKILKTKLDSERYLCQSTCLSQATIKISRTNKLSKLLRKTLRGEISLSAMFKTLFNVILRKFKLIKSSNKGIKGKLKKTTSETLNLQPGELIEVKSFDEIIKTLDEHGKNKGLGFHEGLMEYCGKQLKVRNRFDLMIDEATGKMVNVKNTVFLEDSYCKKCPRERFHYWREIWLRRV